MIEALNSDDIVNKFGGRFKLTALIQKRLGEIIDGARPLVEAVFSAHPSKVKTTQLLVLKLRAYDGERASKVKTTRDQFHQYVESGDCAAVVAAMTMKRTTLRDPPPPRGGRRRPSAAICTWERTTPRPRPA